MSATGELIAALVAGGMDAAEAAGLVARAAVEMTGALTRKSSSAARQQRYRDRNKSVTERNACEDGTVTERNETVTWRNGADRNETVTNRNESVTRDAAIYISSNKEEEERKIDIPDRNALRVTLTADQEAREIARQKGLDPAEVAAIYLDHLESKGAKTGTAAGFRNFLRQHRAPAPAVQRDINPQPSLADYDRAAGLFAKSASLWSSQLGPEPGMARCRCPPDILIKHGIDPKTGMRMQ